MERFTKHYLQELTVCFYWDITYPTKRSVNNSVGFHLCYANNVAMLSCLASFFLTIQCTSTSSVFSELIHPPRHRNLHLKNPQPLP
jgi:hypothetical protein